MLYVNTLVLMKPRPVTQRTETERQLDAMLRIVWKSGCLKRPQPEKVPRFNNAIFFTARSTEGKGRQEQVSRQKKMAVFWFPAL
jgi:hypothetical protein